MIVLLTSDLSPTKSLSLDGALSMESCPRKAVHGKLSTENGTQLKESQRAPACSKVLIGPNSQGEVFPG
jgi:hypothetical protein